MSGEERVSYSIHVGDLSPKVNEKILYEVFKQIGPISSIKICKDRDTGASLGYGYVNFQNPEHVDVAITKFNSYAHDGKHWRVSRIMRDPAMRKSGVGNIFIKNLDKNVDSADLKDIFSSFGTIISAKVALTDKGESKGYGFVQFKTKEEADAAIQNVNGLLINSKEVSVAHYIPRTQRDTKGGSENTFTNIYVKNVDKSTTNEEFKEFFSQFGNVTSCSTLKFEPKYDSYFGFVNFETHEEAVKAIDEINNKKVTLKSKELFATQALSKEDRTNKLKSSNVYVKEFEASITEEDLKSIFSKYGEIKTVKIMKGNNNVSLCFGFICFSDPFSAQNAIKDSKTPLINNIYVSIAKTKEERKKELLSLRPPTRGYFPYLPNFPPNMPLPYPPMGFPVPRGPNDVPIRPPPAGGVPYFPPGPMVPNPSKPPANLPHPPPSNYLYYPPPNFNRKSPLTLEYLMGLPNEKRVQEVKKLFIEDFRARIHGRDDAFYDKVYTALTKKFYPLESGRILPALLNLYEDQQRLAIELHEVLKSINPSS